MVFRKKAKARRSSSRYSHKTSRHGSSGVSFTDLLIGGAIYGVARPYVANMLPDLFNFGPVDSDNAIIGAAGYYGMKHTKGVMKATSMMAVAGEAAIVASRLSQGVKGSSNSIADW